MVPVTIPFVSPQVMQRTSLGLRQGHNCNMGSPVQYLASL